MATMAATRVHPVFLGTSLLGNVGSSVVFQKSHASRIRLYSKTCLVSRSRQLETSAVLKKGAAAPVTSSDLVLVDHFARLGVPRDATNAQIAGAYKARCKEVTDYEEVPEVARQQLEALAISFDVLITEEDKRLYLWGLMRTENPTTYTWPYEADPTQGVISGTPPRQQAPEDEEGTRILGYYFLGWFVLSVVLSLTLK